MNLKKLIRPGKGASDITPIFADSEAFGFLIDKLVGLIDSPYPTKIVSIEGRGFILGSAIAYKLKAGLVPVRAGGKLKNLTYSKKYTDYSGKEKTLEIHQDAINRGERVVIVDDWVETGATLQAAIELVERGGGVVGGMVAFMDDSSDFLKESLVRYNYRFLERVAPEDRF